MTNLTIDPLEVAKFAQHAGVWWDSEGPLKTLHDINPARLAFIQRYASLQGQRVLDLGCGGGILSEAMAKAGALVTGLDVEKAAIQCAQAHASQHSLAIDYVCQSVETYDAPAFSLITCMEMLEHVQDVDELLAHAARLLQPGGRLFLSTINRTLWAYATVIVGAEYVLNVLPRQTHDYKKFIKPSELARSLRAHGLSVDGISGMNYHPWTRKATLQPSVESNYLLVCSK